MQSAIWKIITAVGIAGIGTLVVLEVQHQLPPMQNPANGTAGSSETSDGQHHHEHLPGDSADAAPFFLAAESDRSKTPSEGDPAAHTGAKTSSAGTSVADSEKAASPGASSRPTPADPVLTSLDAANNSNEPPVDTTVNRNKLSDLANPFDDAPQNPSDSQPAGGSTGSSSGGDGSPAASSAAAASAAVSASSATGVQVASFQKDESFSGGESPFGADATHGTDASGPSFDEPQTPADASEDSPFGSSSGKSPFSPDTDGASDSAAPDSAAPGNRASDSDKPFSADPDTLSESLPTIDFPSGDTASPDDIPFSGDTPSSGDNGSSANNTSGTDEPNGTGVSIPAADTDAPFTRSDEPLPSRENQFREEPAPRNPAARRDDVTPRDRKNPGDTPASRGGSPIQFFGKNSGSDTLKTPQPADVDSSRPFERDGSDPVGRSGTGRTESVFENDLGRQPSPDDTENGSRSFPAERPVPDRRSGSVRRPGSENAADNDGMGTTLPFPADDRADRTPEDRSPIGSDRINRETLPNRDSVGSGSRTPRRPIDSSPEVNEERFDSNGRISGEPETRDRRGRSSLPVPGRDGSSDSSRRSEDRLPPVGGDRSDMFVPEPADRTDDRRDRRGGRNTGAENDPAENPVVDERREPDSRSGRESSTPAEPHSQVLRPHLTLRKDAPETASVGVPLEYRIVVSNEGRSTAYEVIVEDDLPRAATLETTEPQVTEFDRDTRKLLWKFDELPPGKAKEITVRMTPTGEGTLGGVATVRFKAEVKATTVVTAPRLTLEMSGPPEAKSGDELNYTYVVRNEGSGRASDVILRTILPAGLTHSEGPDLEYEIDALEPSESREVVLTVVADKPGDFKNAAEVTSSSVAMAQKEIEVRIIGAQLKIERLGPEHRHVDRSAQFQNVITNVTRFDAEDIIVRELVPEGMRFVSADKNSDVKGQYNPESRIITWRIPKIPAEKHVLLEVELVPETQGEKESRVEIEESAGFASDLVKILTVEHLHNVSADISRLDGPVEVGEEFVFEITIENRGTAAATGVLLELQIPEEIEIKKGGNKDEGISARTAPGNRVIFDTVKEIAPRQVTRFQLVLQGQNPVTNSLVEGQVKYDGLRKPLVVSEAVTVFSDR